MHWISWKVLNVWQKMAIRVVLMRMSTLRFMSRRGQGHCLTFDRMTISNISSKATGLIVTEAHLQPPGADGTKICSNCIVHMTNMATTPIYGKIL